MLLVVTLGPAAADAQAALAAAAGMAVTILPVLRTAGAVHGTVLIVDAGLGARIKYGLEYALRAGATVAAVVPALDAGAIECVAALARLVAGGTDVAFARRGARHGWEAMAATTAALSRIPFTRNDDDALFPIELALQAEIGGLRTATVAAGPMRLGARPSPLARLRAVLTARVQRLHILYDRRFDCAPDTPAYEQKLGYKTPHTLAAQLVPADARVLDLGAADGYVARLLAAQGCTVTAVDRVAPPQDPGVTFVVHDLDRGPPPIELRRFDVVLMLDVVEHLRAPELFIDALAAAMSGGARLILSTGNVAFIVTRLMLLVGQFNYGKRGILDLTHTRLFTPRTIERLLREAGFRVRARHAVPAPFAAALGSGPVARALTALNDALAWLLPGLFAYQIVIVAEPRAALDALTGPQGPGGADRTDGTR